MGQIALRMKHNDTTSVSNIFIDEYMTNANEAPIKIYLYLLRCIEGKLPVSVTAMADRFNYTEKDVLRSLFYWEKNGLLSVEFDRDKNVVGICLNDCKNTNNDKTETVAVNNDTVSSDTLSTESTKPFYSLDQMNEFKNKEDVQSFIFMTEHYLGKLLSSSDLNSLLYMYNVLKFPISLMEYLVEYCVNAGNRSMRYIEKVAISWAEDGIKTVEDARAYIADSCKYRKECYQVLKAFGITSRSIVDSDIEYVSRWIDEYGFQSDVIIEACRRTIQRTSKPSFSYADGILKRWSTAGIHHLSDITRADDEYKEKSSANIASANKVTSNKFRNFDERDVDYDDIAAKLMASQTPISK